MRRSRVPALRGRKEVRDVKLFVSSPGDVAPERGRVEAVVAKLNRDYDGLARFVTVLWEENFYKADSTFQAQIPEAAACDIVVSIFWTRIGTELPPDFARMPDGRPYPSGTAYELLTALDALQASGVPTSTCFARPRRSAADRRCRAPPPGADAARCARCVLERVVQVARPDNSRRHSKASPAPTPSSRRSSLLGKWLQTMVSSDRVWRGRRRRARRSGAWRRSRPSTRQYSSAAVGQSTRRAGTSPRQPNAGRRFC